MKTSTKQTTVTTERGTVLNFTVVAERGYESVTEKVWVDEYVERETIKEINKTTATIEVNGKKYEGYFTTSMPQSVLKGCYGAFLAGSQPIGLSKKIYNELTSIVEEAKKEAETDENWMALQAKKEQARKEEEEYYKHNKAVNAMMTMNGKTY